MPRKRGAKAGKAQVPILVSALGAMEKTASPVSLGLSGPATTSGLGAASHSGGNLPLTILM